MVTGYDHLLFLFGVIFFLYKMRDIGLYVSLFAVGHSTTLLIGTFFDISVSAYLIDAIIGLSVVYKALDNLGAFQRWFGFQPNTKMATLIFGFFHGFGTATKIKEFEISPMAFCQPDCLQCRGRARSAFGAKRHPYNHELLATDGELFPPCLHRQRGDDERRFPVNELPDLWLHFSLREKRECITPIYRPAQSCRLR